jgi:hypothetical protein
LLGDEREEASGEERRGWVFFASIPTEVEVILVVYSPSAQPITGSHESNTTTEPVKNGLYFE